jgi:hypothetical protein
MQMFVVFASLAAMMAAVSAHNWVNVSLFAT